MSARRTKASRRAAFRAHCDRTTEPVYDAPPLRPFLSRCRPRCGGSEWLSCWCGMCGEEPCYGCVDCNGEPDADYDDADWGDDDDFAVMASQDGAA